MKELGLGQRLGLGQKLGQGLGQGGGGGGGRPSILDIDGLAGPILTGNQIYPDRRSTNTLSFSYIYFSKFSYIPCISSSGLFRLWRVF